MTRGNSFLLACIAAFSLVLMPMAANAAPPTQLSCTSTGGVAGGVLYPATTGQQGACEFTGITHIASSVICNFVVILNNVLGKVYCGIQFSMTGILGIVLTLYVTLFGAQILMGKAQLNGREILTRLLKIGGVWGFATQSAWGIGVAFQFFLAIINSGSAWVINSLVLTTALPVADTASDVMPLYGYLDTLIYNAIAGPVTIANDKLIGFFFALTILFPPLLMMGFYWLRDTCKLLIKAILGFMLCLSALAFLITLSPIFLSFMLFQATSHFFENWLRYMASYVLQIIFVFAIIMLWITVMGQFVTFFNTLTNMLYPYQQTLDVGGVIIPNNTWAICDGASYSTNGGTNGFPTAACPSGFVPGNNNLIPPSKINEVAGFIYFVTFYLIALILIAYTFQALLEHANRIVRNLVGLSSGIPALGTNLSGSGSIAALMGG